MDLATAPHKAECRLKKGTRNYRCDTSIGKTAEEKQPLYYFILYSPLLVKYKLQQEK